MENKWYGINSILDLYGYRYEGEITAMFQIPQVYMGLGMGSHKFNYKTEHIKLKNPLLRLMVKYNDGEKCYGIHNIEEPNGYMCGVAYIRFMESDIINNRYNNIKPIKVYLREKQEHEIYIRNCYEKAIKDNYKFMIDVLT